jgi:creatinine amidohydrolase/Fe(II)-dependent formamide hydrolase-like protein
MWTHYQPAQAAGAILARTVEQLVAYGFRAIVLFAGHYPWQTLLDRQLSALRDAHPEVLFLWGTEMNIGGEAVPLPGDHAAREEASYGLALFPQWVDLDALHPGRDESAWPNRQQPPAETRAQYPEVCFDPRDALFAQMGEDARTATAARGEAALSRLVDHLAGIVNEHKKA